MQRLCIFVTVLSTACGAGRDPGARPDASVVADAAVEGHTPLRNVDVTIIYPLPTTESRVGWMSARTLGRDGALLPATVFEGRVPELDALDPLPDDDTRLDALYVVAIRFDPCAGVPVPSVMDATCHAQLRLVFQSLRTDGGARDGAIHAFYALTSAERAEVVAELRMIRSERLSDPASPLGIHPRLAAEGVDGPYARRVQALVLAYVGPTNLVRVTHFRRLDDFPVAWDFAIRERAGPSWHDAVVATTTVTTERLLTIVGGRWDAVMTPTPSHDDDPTRLFRARTEELSSAFSATVRLLNPRIHSSESVDCASCHIASDISVFARETMSLKVSDDAAHFQTSYSLEHTETDIEEVIGFVNMHMSSYLGRSLGLSIRTVNETAAVLELLDDR